MSTKEKRFKTYPHKYGEGKVHRYLWSYENKVWYVPCRGAGIFDSPHGEVVDDSTELTCKKCQPEKDQALDQLGDEFRSEVVP